MPTALIAVLPILFVAIWVGVCRLLAEVGGWSRLVRAYGRPWEPGETPLHAARGQTMRIGRARYKNCVEVRATPASLEMRPMILFRSGHPPISIPWQDLQVTPGTTGFWRTADLRTARVPAVAIRISWSLAREIAAATSGALRLPEAV